MASTFTDLGLELMATGENAGTWGTKTNANLSLIEQLTGGVLSLAVAGSGTTALTIADGALTGTAQQRVIELTGALTGSRILTFPLLTETFYIIKNGTTNAQTLQLKAVSGSGATVTFAADNKGYKLIYLDGVATNTGVFEATIGEANEVTLTGTQTLTNKTLTAPKIGTSILDTNGNELVLLSATSSAVNEFTLKNASTNNDPTLSVTGGDSNINLKVGPKGTGLIEVLGATNPGSIQLNCEQNTHGQQIKSQPHSASVTNVMLLPAGANSTLVSLVSTDTLTNKTLTSPKINDTTAITATGTEINYSDLATLGTSAASKVLSANANNLTTISGAVLNTEDTLTDGSTIAWNVINSPVAKVTLAGNRTMAAPSGTGPAAGQFISLLAIQDGTGSRTITWNAVYEFPSDTAPTLTTTANLGDIFSFRYNGAKWLLIGQTLALTLS